jgi:hypothetical protein
MWGHTRLPCSPCGRRQGQADGLVYRHPAVSPACVAARGRRQVSYLCAAARSLRARRRRPLRPPSRPVGTWASAPTVSATDTRPASAPASRARLPRQNSATHISPRYSSVYFKSPQPRPQLNPVLYKGFTITARTFQVHGSGRWTLDLLIGRNTDLRAFSDPSTYPTEESAITGCCEFGQRIIDGRVRNCSVDDLS